MTRSSKEYFDSVGAEWDRLRAGFFPDRVRTKVLSLAGIETGRQAADLGAGTGFLTRGLLERGVRVIAVDQSAVMLEALRRKLSSHGDLDCRLGEAEELPIADASVDYCLANMLLHHVEDPRVAVAEMARILRPGGRVVVTDLDRHGFAFFRELYRDRWLGFERSDVRTWFRAAGLTSVRVEDLGEECCALQGGGHAAVRIFVASGSR